MDINLSDVGWQDISSKIDEILLASGRLIIPDSKHQRFRITKKNLEIQYGHSELYGTRLLNFKADSKKTIILQPKDNNFQIRDNFRQPLLNDLIVSGNGEKSFIESILKYANMYEIRLLKEINHLVSPLSFCDYQIYSAHKKDCIFDPLNAQYIRFIPVEQSLSKHEIINEIIPVKSIKNIVYKKG